MPHAWILDVLTDLRSYAERNSLPAIAQAATDALTVAETELTAHVSAEHDNGQD